MLRIFTLLILIMLCGVANAQVLLPQDNARDMRVITPVPASKGASPVSVQPTAPAQTQSVGRQNVPYSQQPQYGQQQNSPLGNDDGLGWEMFQCKTDQDCGLARAPCNMFTAVNLRHKERYETMMSRISLNEIHCPTVDQDDQKLINTSTPRCVQNFCVADIPMPSLPSPQIPMLQSTTSPNDNSSSPIKPLSK
jgi:hypothetical protein